MIYGRSHNLMFRILFFTVLGLMSLSAFGSDTLRVITHNQVTVVTDPSKGYNTYTKWGVFPSASVAVRRVLLHVRFACPDSMRCADWDYLDFITIKRTGSARNRSVDYEIARMLTPYGGAFSKDWSFDWTVDVTDFSMLIRDSVEIEYNHTGYEENKDRGWKITLEFEIITGKPAFEPLGIEKVYHGSFLYGDADTSIEYHLKPFAFKRIPRADWAAFRIHQTGHGMHEYDGCGEFCSKWREVVLNGTVIHRKDLWMECSNNALFPQAGTWIFDRANWCPGYLQIPDICYFQPIETNEIDINMQPYLAPEKPTANESVVAYLIQYRKNHAGNDVAITEVVNPAGRMVYSRAANLNEPAAIEIQNMGNSVLRTVKFTYGTEGLKKQSFVWKGALNPMERTTVLLPGIIAIAGVKNIFEVEALQPNGKTDEYKEDNRKSVSFEALPVHSNKMVIALKTNHEPAHNYYKIVNAGGEVVRSKTFGAGDENRIFRDTLNLIPGRYYLELYDTANDGLEFWFNDLAGYGYIRLEDEKGRLVKPFLSDFGCCLLYAFEVSEDEKRWNPLPAEPSVILYPTRTTGLTTLDYFGSSAEDVKVIITTDDGKQIVEEHLYRELKEGKFSFQLNYRKPQRYYMKVFVKDELVLNKRIRVIEAP